MDSISNQKLNDYTKLIEDNLFKYTKVTHDLTLEKDVIEAMNYSLSAGGKRIRPILVLEFCRLCGGSLDKAIATAVGVEMLHTSSLIHDDLPCMDDDDFRRGKPSCHKQFNEWLAVLGGDNLMVKPFEIIANDEKLLADTRVRLISSLSKATGFEGIIGGQVLDIQNEDRKNVTEEILTQTCLEKTGALIRSACEMGCLCAEQHPEKIQFAIEYANYVGLAFQIVDDILDVIGDESILGKPIGSDEEQHKTTFVTLLGLEGAKHKAELYTEKALKALENFEDNSFMVDLTKYLLVREY
jgi:geranylgeranyl diphosphate synthase type II